MKKMIAVLILAGAAATPAFASDGSEIAMQSRPGYVATTDAMGSYARAQYGAWQNTNNGQWQMRLPIIDR